MRPPYKLYPPGSRRDNPFYIVRGRRPDQREFEATTGSADPEAAGRIAADIYARIVNEGRRPAPVGRTFDEACVAYVRWRNPSSADRERIGRLRRLLGPLPVTAVGQEDLVRAAAQHPRKVTGATLNREYTRPFAAVLHYARDADMRGDIRVRAFPERAVNVRVAEKGDVQILIANAKTEPQRLLLCWLWELGSRITDTLRADWEGVDLAGSTIRLAIGKRGGAIVTLPLPETLVAALANMPARAGRVFPWRTKSGVYKWLRPLCLKVGVKFRPHDARRALATEHFDAGADPRLVQELMAHGSLKSTMRYRHVGVARLADAQKRRG